MANVISVIVLAALALLFIWLATRALRARRGFVKWPGLVLSGLLALVFLAVTVVSVLGFYRLNNSPYKYQVSNVQVSMAPEKVARGERLAHICIDCHSSTGSLPLDGSKEDFLKSPGAPPVGSMWASNLTPGGPLKDWTDGEIIRALREGIDKNGRPLVIMPSMAFHSFSDDDAAALVAYLRSQPAVERDLPERDLNVLGAVFFGAGMFPTSAQTPITQPVVAPPPGTPEYGQYLVKSTGCQDCHGPNLDGVVSGPGPSGAPNLTVAVPNYSDADFNNLFRNGVAFGGRKIDPLNMPWMIYGQAFSDEEIHDIYTFLRSLPRVESPAK